MPLSDRLKTLRKQAGLTQTQLEKLSGVSQSTISDLERGQLKSTTFIPELARALDKEPADLDPRYEPLPKGVANASNPKPLVSAPLSPSIPRYSSAVAGAEGRFLMDVVSELVPAPPGLTHPDAYAVHIVGDSMEPALRAGFTAYVHPTRPIRRGDDVVAQIYEQPGGAAVVGLVKRFVAYTDEELVVEQFNPPREIRFPRPRVKSVHKVVWVERD